MERDPAAFQQAGDHFCIPMLREQSPAGREWLVDGGVEVPRAQRPSPKMPIVIQVEDLFKVRDD